MSEILLALMVGGALVGISLIAWYLGRVQMEAHWARYRQANGGRSHLRARMEEELAQERARVAEETARRKALDEFLTDLHAEERAYLRERNLGDSKKRSVVVEERLCFRNLPVSNWNAQELTFYSASGTPDLAKALPRSCT